MAKTKTKIKGLEYQKPKTSLYLCCFGSVHHKTPTDHSSISEHNVKQKSRSNSWFPWQRIRLGVKNSMARTVPLEGTEVHEKEKLKLKFKGKANKVHSSMWKWNSKSKSDLLNRTQSNSTPNQTPSKSQLNRGNNIEDVTRQQSRSSSLTKAASHRVSLPTSKRQVRRFLSSKHSQTTSKHAKRKQIQNAERYNPVVATSVVMIALVSMILWGRLCSIACTSAWLYLIPSFTMTAENDKQNSVNDSNDLVLDSKMDKRKVIPPKM
ncbi:hypothetical protein E2542_SST10644 [Spatholobus suberectus]|nr:hypothetical protein E2542_SST10644 [Spatholobus suberectus]